MRSTAKLKSYGVTDFCEGVPRGRACHNRTRTGNRSIADSETRLFFSSDFHTKSVDFLKHTFRLQKIADFFFFLSVFFYFLLAAVKRFGVAWSSCRNGERAIRRSIGSRTASHGGVRLLSSGKHQARREQKHVIHFPAVSSLKLTRSARTAESLALSEPCRITDSLLIRATVVGTVATY